MTVAARTGPGAASGLLLWTALATASLGVLMDLFGHWLASPWSRYSLLFLVLCAWMGRAAPAGEPAPRLGMTLVALGAVAEVLAIGGGFERYGRLGLGVALVGMACLQGLPGWARRLSLLWLIPLPHFVVSTAGERLLPLWASFGGTVAGWVDPAASWADPARWLTEGTGLGLDGVAGGLCVVVVLAGCGWLSSARQGASLSAAVQRSLCWGSLGIPLQAGCVALAAITLAWQSSSPEIVGYALMHATWWAAAAVGLTLCWLRRAEGRRA